MPNGKTGGKIYLTVIGLALALIGAVFTWLMGKSYARAAAMDDWVKLPSVVLESGVETRQIGGPGSQEWQFQILYAYEYEETNYESTQISRRGARWISNREEVEQRVEQNPVGSELPCWVNPEEPEESVLERDSKAPGYSLWFPLVFVVGGLGVSVGAWFRKS